jgi:hypothetical protein
MIFPARKCTLPAVPNNGVYDKTEVKFGERLKLTCQLTNDDADKKELNAVCIYKDKDTGLGFAGDDITKCPGKMRLIINYLMLYTCVKNINSHIKLSFPNIIFYFLSFVLF